MNEIRVVRIRNGKPTIKFLHNYLQTNFSFLKEGEKVRVIKNKNNITVLSTTRKMIERYWRGVYE